MDIIAGDIGGTKSWLAWAGVDAAGSAAVRFERVYASADFASAEALLHQFYTDAGQAAKPAAVCLALPGPVQDGKPIRLTNLDWTLEKATLQAQLATPRLLFINDFQAAAEGVATLTAADYSVLNAASPGEGAVRVITGAGTGLGLAWMQVDATGRYHTFATEGGHTDFAPANAQQERLLAFMRQSLSHVSWERVLSGPGVNYVYQFCLQDMTGEIPPALAGRNGALVNADALEGDPVAVAAMELFTDLYANWVGNIALLYQPRGGLYLGGGVSARIQPWLQTQRFLDACFDKGRMSALVQQMPIYLITNTRLGLQGALAAAMNTTHN
ncbi:MAG: glucokinase [Thiothrix sp.]|uniref:glucokinase n=1 Tax=Thiothrix sp. TaxID=1032 RepID=UPI002631FD00|nr:glucokinase [Thiothrix sp.]MDD5391667.1 glucokinase [Thiothrix sp.]